jgi:hypothetical protein
MDRNGGEADDGTTETLGGVVARVPVRNGRDHLLRGSFASERPRTSSLFALDHATQRVRIAAKFEI